MKQTISETVDEWIREEDFPTSPVLKIVRQSDPWQGMTEEEIDDRKEYIRCYLLKDFELVLMIPVQPGETDFWFSSHEEFMESAFNTWDFQKTQKPFDKYGYRIKKVLEQVEDLAIMHFCISQPEGRENIRKRFELLVKNEFTESLLTTIEKYQHRYDEERRAELRHKIGKLSRHILECKATWQRYSPQEDEPSQTGKQNFQASSQEQEEALQQKNNREMVRMERKATEKQLAYIQHLRRTQTPVQRGRHKNLSVLHRNCTGIGTKRRTGWGRGVTKMRKSRRENGGFKGNYTLWEYIETSEKTADREPEIRHLKQPDFSTRRIHTFHSAN